MDQILSATIALPIVAAVFMAFWCAYMVAIGRGDRYGWLLIAAAFASLLPQKVIPAFLQLAARTYSVRIDLYLEATERLLGNPSFALGRLLLDHPALAFASAIAYNLMPMGMLAIAVIYVHRPEYPAVVKSVLVGLVAALPLYFIFPASGPRQAFPSFPISPDPVTPHLVHIPTVNNCVPSVHFAMTLLIAFLLWRWWWMRPAAIAYSALTAIACLGFGEHYAIDLIASVPYVLAVGAFAFRTRPITAWFLPMKTALYTKSYSRRSAERIFRTW